MISYRETQDTLNLVFQTRSHTKLGKLRIKSLRKNEDKIMKHTKTSRVLPFLPSLFLRA